ncbi:kinase-like domain-containing protein [Xylariaceae sp. FL0255]|nr:kinase-like domain-containing protein [Xylariaceae sp. FL0255]
MVLFQPSDLDPDFDVSGATLATLFPKGLPPRQDRPGTGVQCLAVRESPEYIGCYIHKPFGYKIFFDPYEDDIVVANRSSFELLITPSAPSSTDSVVLKSIESDSDMLVAIAPFEQAFLGTRAWVFSQSSPEPRHFQLLIFPRTQVLQLMTLSVRSIAGSKRDTPHNELPAQGKPGYSSAVAGKLYCLGELGDGQKARFHAPDGEEQDNISSRFTLFRMQGVGETGSAAVFKAQHSEYPHQIIVVKAFKRSLEHDAKYRGRSWQREYKVHLDIESDYIREANKRTGKNIHENTDRLFLGTLTDTQCVLRDMARALQYLRRKKILHNDIKPGNILYNGKKATLIDFGLGTHDGAAAYNPSGTPWYIPPEYLRREERKAPSNVWALGVVMLYLLRQVALPDTGIDVPH